MAIDAALLKSASQPLDASSDLRWLSWSALKRLPMLLACFLSRPTTPPLRLRLIVSRFWRFLQKVRTTARALAVYVLVRRLQDGQIIRHSVTADAVI